MKAPRLSFKTLPPEWRDCEAWPAADLSTVDDDVRDRFDRLARGLRLYLSTGRLKAAAIEAGCSGGVLIDLLNRCVHVHSTGDLIGWAGLISRLRVRGYTRIRVECQGGAHGFAGKFQQFLRDNEEKRKALHQIIRAGGGPKSTRSQAPTFRSVFTTFRAFCLADGMTMGDYPWCSKSGGRRSIERYAVSFIASDTAAAKVWYGADAAVGLSLGTGNKSFPFAMAPLDVVGADAHKIHCIGVVMINGPAGPQPVPVERLWIYPVVEKKTRCILSYSVSIRREISAANIEEALVACSRPWKPRLLIVEGQRYLDGAGLPVGTIPGLTECRPCVIRIDNAAQHFAKRIVVRARRTLGCTIAWGPVGGWWRNAVTERVFRTLELYGFQRLPSSTGSHPKDPRRPDSVANAIKHRISWDELLDLIDVTIANYNITNHRGLGNRAPLEVLATLLQSSDSIFIPRPSAPETVNTPKLGITVETRFVAGCARKGQIKRPYVEVDKVHYTAPALSNRFDLLKKPIVLHINEGDMRSLHAFVEGRPIGELTAQAEGWRHTAHTREMRKAINALIDTGGIPPDSTDYVLEYMKKLVARTHQEASDRPSRKSPSGTLLADAARVSGAPIPELPTADIARRPRAVSRPMPGHIKKPAWRTG